MLLDNLIKTDQPFVIAEIGNNHEGSLDLAIELVDLAVKSKADAVKFQTFIPELFQFPGDLERFQKLSGFCLTFKEFEEISSYCKTLNIPFISTPLDFESLNFLSTISSAIKISSGDNNWVDFIETASKLELPLLLSTGISSNKIIKKSLLSAYKYKDPNEICLMHCVSSYPVPEDHANIAQLNNLAQIHNGPIGYSDHTLGFSSAILSVGMGARIIEKHFTKDNNFSDFRDHKLALNPEDFSSFVESLKASSKNLSDSEYSEIELPLIEFVRRSPMAIANISKGQRITEKDIAWVRPLQSDLEYNFLKETPKYSDRDIQKNEILTSKDIK